MVAGTIGKEHFAPTDRFVGDSGMLQRLPERPQPWVNLAAGQAHADRIVFVTTRLVSCGTPLKYYVSAGNPSLRGPEDCFELSRT